METENSLFGNFENNIDPKDIIAKMAKQAQPECTCHDNQKQRALCPVCDKEAYEKSRIASMEMKQPVKIIDGKQKGKLYVSEFGKMVILCTADQILQNRFAGVVVAQLDKFSDHAFSNYSESWTASVFNECVKEIIIDNKIWEPYKEMAHSPG
jgi:hypothetical protein